MMGAQRLLAQPREERFCAQKVLWRLAATNEPTDPSGII